MAHYSFGYIQGGLSPFFDWNPELEEALPGTATFARASAAFYRNDSGLWVQASSGALRFHNLTAGGGEKVFIREPAATKLALFPRDFTNAVWVASNITPVKDATGIDGVSSAASTLTATDANGTILQTVTSASSAHTFSVFVARKTGTGTIEITVDGGATWVDITSSISSDIKDDPYIVTQTLANPEIGFRIVTSGDEIEVDMGDLEATGFVTTPLDHSSSTSTRVADSVTDVAWPAESSAVVDVTVFDPIGLGYVSGAMNMLGFGSGANRIFAVDDPTVARLLTGGIDITVTASTSYENERHSFGMSLKENEGIIVDDENNSNTDLAGTPGLGTIYIGSANNLAGRPCYIHRVRIYAQTQTVAELEALF